MHEFTTSFQAMTSDDLDFLRRVYASTRSEEMAQSGWGSLQIQDFLDSQFDYQHRYYQSEFPDASYDLILIDGTAAGRLYLDRRKSEHRIIDIALLPDYRGKGIGTRLLKQVLDEANRAGKSVGIHVERNNPALHLYERLGFLKTGESGLYYLMEWNKA